jgi:acetyl esterase/lipase
MKIMNVALKTGAIITCYIQDQSKELEHMNQRRAMLIFPGGGYEFCSDREAEPIALSYLNAGYNAFVLRYRVKAEGNWPNPLEDAILALEYLHKNEEKLHINKHQIAVIGFSAGGHLAASLATTSNMRPNAVLLGYPALIKAPKYGWDYPTPVVDDDTPEAFIFHTFEDTVVPVHNALYIASEYDKKKIPFELHIFKKGVHGLSLSDERTFNNLDFFLEDDFKEWMQLSLRWLDNVFNQ